MGARRLTSVFVAFVLLLATAMLPVASAILAQSPEGESPQAQAESEGPVIGEDAAIAIDASLEPEADLGQGFYYQGTLTESGAPVTASRAMEFRLWNAATAGASVGATLTPTVAVNRGQFSVVLTWSGVFKGQALWLGVRAKDGAGVWRDLGRRQILAVPYATSLMPGARVEGTGSSNTLTVTSSGSAYPLRAIATAAGLDGVWGTGTNQGVYGDTTGSGSADSGVFGGSWANGPSRGGEFYSWKGIGVYARSDALQGVYADAPNHDGVVGTSSVAGRSGVYGYSVNGYGVSAQSGTGTGLNAWSAATSGEHYGVYGYTASTSGIGVVGLQTGYAVGNLSAGWYRSGGLFLGRNGVIGQTNTSNGDGVLGVNMAGRSAVHGYNGTTTGWAGLFDGSGNGVSITTPTGKTGLVVYNGSKSAAVPTDEGDRLLYSEESTEVWFTDYGFGTLVDGVATVAIDPLFAQTVNLSEPYHVFLQANGPAAVYLESTAPDSFTVKALTGDGNVGFSYRLVAVRLGYEGARLEAAPSDGALGTEGAQAENSPVAGVVAP